MTRPFPEPGRLVQAAYRELEIAASGGDAERAVLGRVESLGRPWDPPSCAPAVRQQVWAWLDEVAAWVNHEHGWGVDRLIPPCWPAHPHIGHELAVLADQRRAAGLALGGDLLEEWHRYSLPMFQDRLVGRLGNRCVTKHDEWPAAARHRAYVSEGGQQQRAGWFADDLASIRATTPRPDGDFGPFAVVNRETGELFDPRRPNGGR